MQLLLMVASSNVAKRMVEAVGLLLPEKEGPISMSPDPTAAEEIPPPETSPGVRVIVSLQAPDTWTEPVIGN